MIVSSWGVITLVGGFVALAATACIIEWRLLAAEVPSGRGLESRSTRRRADA